MSRGPGPGRRTRRGWPGGALGLLGLALAQACTPRTTVHESDADRAQAAAGGRMISRAPAGSGSGTVLPAAPGPVVVAAPTAGDGRDPFVTRPVPADHIAPDAPGPASAAPAPEFAPTAGPDPSLMPVPVADSPVVMGQATPGGVTVVPADMPFSSVTAYGNRDLPSAPLPGGDEDVFYELPPAVDGRPPGPAAAEPPTPTADPVRAALGGPVDYVQVRVAEGDTLFGLAFRFQTDARVIAAVNGLGPEQAIYPGQLLRVPVARLARGPDGTVTLGGAGLAPGVAVPALPADAGAGAPLPPPILGPDPPGGIVAVTPTAGAPLKVVPGAFPPLGAGLPPAGLRQRLGPPTVLLAGGGAPVRVTPGPAREAAPVTRPAASAPTVAVAAEPVSPPAPVPAPPAPTPAPASPGPGPASPELAAGTRARWPWPTDGRVVVAFAPDAGAKGIDIAGRAGQPVRAVAPGKVVYSGNALKGYGELVIVKHSNVFLTAYAYNRKRLVRQGEDVVAGQPIAEMGTGPTGTPVLHFEVREKGLPVEPQGFLGPGP